MPIEETSLEKMSKQIEDILAELESGDVDLEKSVQKYEEGLNLIQKAQKKLKDIEGKVEIIKKKFEKE